MNDRVLNEKESLELIAQMIQNTKSRMTRNSGAPFLIWGSRSRLPEWYGIVGSISFGGYLLY